MRKTVSVENWTMAIVPHAEVLKGFDTCTAAGVKQCGYTVLPATVPGNFELDMMKAGLLEDLYYGENVLKAQQLEDRHLWYTATFTLEATAETEPFLVFGGIDTASRIYLDGELLGETENMLIPHEFSLAGIAPGEHEVVVHIIPDNLYAQNHPAPIGWRSMIYHSYALELRKAPYMYGWDIMPRIVTGGLWKPVTVEYRPVNRIEEFYIYAESVAGTDAKLHATMRVSTPFLNPGSLTYKIEGVCEDSSFVYSGTLIGTTRGMTIRLPNAKLWMPKNYGEPNLYRVTVTLYHGDQVCDTKVLSLGVRTVELIRTSEAGENGEFVFKVNGKKIFCMGTNWLPTDAFPSRHGLFQERALKMLLDIHCNIVRTWGGNVYLNEEFFDFCDRNGILIWQDFSMACAKYPNGPEFLRKMEAEAVSVVHTFRNHPSLLLWSGDNECDEASKTILQQDGKVICRIDPNENTITRQLLPRVIREHDPARPFLPSSPYLDPVSFTGDRPSEDHLWGPRDFFKGAYYGNAAAHFASETGYHGCPSPETLKKFIPADHLMNWGDSKLCDDRVWLTHAACMEPVPGALFANRIPLMTSQVERIFGESSRNLEEYALQSQISQAEAKKYFIERFRIGKWRRTGIIWWNLIDGWPQISDAVVDWYGCKKLAYHYIKTCQTPFCMMVDEPKEGMLTLCAANDTRENKQVRYTVTNLVSGQVVLQGVYTVDSDTTARIAKFPQETGACYLIRWEGDETGFNHFVADIGGGITLTAYSEWLREMGYWDLLEGFQA